MNEYAQIYNEYGLKEMIQDNKNKIAKKQKEFHEICAGKRQNHLCEDGWKNVIHDDIKCYENEIVELEEALKIQKDKFNNICS